MGTIFSDILDIFTNETELQKKYNNLAKDLKVLKNSNEQLKKQLAELKTNYDQKIDKFVEEWYE